MPRPWVRADVVVVVVVVMSAVDPLALPSPDAGAVVEAAEAAGMTVGGRGVPNGVLNGSVCKARNAIV